MVLFLQDYLYVLEAFYMELIEWFFEYHGAAEGGKRKRRFLTDPTENCICRRSQ
jgi:hypothetical protein